MSITDYSMECALFGHRHYRKNITIRRGWHFRLSIVVNAYFFDRVCALLRFSPFLERLRAVALFAFPGAS
jgi:hypothetical protein